MTACLSPNGRDVYASNSPPARLLVGTSEGVVELKRQAAGEPWATTDRALQGRHISSLLLEPTQGGLFAGVHAGGLYASFDGGRTWAAKTRGLRVEHVYSLASTERDGQVVLYAGTEPARLFQSTDYGENWEDVSSLREVPGTERWEFPSPPHIAHVKDITFDPQDSRIIYVSVEQGALLKSTDAGQSWRELAGYYSPDDETYKDVHRLKVVPSDPDSLYLVGGLGLYCSEDGGETWERRTARGGFRVGYPDAFQISPLDNNGVFMAGARDNPGTWRTSHFADSCIVRSRDAGRSWEILEGLPRPLRANIEAMSLEVWPQGYALFAGTTDGEVFLSEDEGESWSLVASGVPPVSKGTHYAPLSVPA